MRHARTIVAVALLAAAVPAAAARADGPSATAGMKRLSDERTLSRWAYPNNHARVRSRPTSHARTVATLHWLSEDNLPEIYLVLASWRDSHGNTGPTASPSAPTASRGGCRAARCASTRR